MIITKTSSPMQRSVILTNYIPLQVRAKKECQVADYYSIRKSDTSLLELTFDQTDHLIHRITLIICAEYHKTSEEYQLPNEYTHGDLIVESSAEIDTAVFSCIIFRNAVKITFSDLAVCKRVLSDNVVWELSDQGKLVSLCVIDTTGRASEHCSVELSGYH